MGYKSKKYEVGARAFIEQNKGPADIFEGKWNSSRGGQSGETQITILDKSTKGISYGGD